MYSTKFCGQFSFHQLIDLSLSVVWYDFVEEFYILMSQYLLLSFSGSFQSMVLLVLLDRSLLGGMELPIV